MERILHYEIKASDDSPTVACFLKRQGYSSANLTDLKKMPESILINGTPSYMIRHLQGGDRLTVHIQETAVSEKIPPVYHPLDIVYEDEDLMVINKPADLPIHPSMRNYHPFPCKRARLVFCSERLSLRLSLYQPARS